MEFSNRLIVLILILLKAVKIFFSSFAPCELWNIFGHILFIKLFSLFVIILDIFHFKIHEFLYVLCIYFRV